MSFELDSQSYGIEDELKVRGILEERTDWNYEFTKNSKHAPDLQLHNWGDEPEQPEDRDLTGYIEIEVTHGESGWQTGAVPDGWSTINFLKRKIRRYDYQQQRRGALKRTARQTVYLKFNHAQDNCFAAPVEKIFRDGVETKASDGSFNNSYLKLGRDHPDVHVGIRDCVSFIERYLEDRVDQNQQRIGDWA